ncbi:MAG: hypothetical protein HFI75_00330 [Lachnospiraceae bacterium]|nr:hypothetical protein [Lachnospiraceae bacterium]
MNINGLGSKINVGNQQKTQKNQDWKDTVFFNRFNENVSNRKKDSYERYDEELMETIAGSYEYYSIKYINRIKESGKIEMSAVTETSIRNLSYEQSDHIQINVKEGYSYRSQVDVSGHSVYLEYRDDSGEVKAYMADVSNISKDTENPVEQMALASWNKVMEENRKALGYTEVKKPILAGDTVPGKYVNGCFISEMETYEDTIYLGKFGDACGMAGLFGGDWSAYYPVKDGEGHPESVEVKLFTGRTVIVDKDRLSQVGNLKGVLSKAEYAQLEAAIAKQTSSDYATSEKWDQVLPKPEDAMKEFKDQMKVEAEEEEVKSGPRMKVPYSHLVKDGIIEYNGVVFTCDEEKNAICLGDMSNMDNVLIIPLAKGGSLYVNRDNFGDLARAITMFSAEDRNRIMRAIQKDKKVQQLKQEIEDEKASVGETIEEKGEEVQNTDKGQEQQTGAEQALDAESGGDSQIVVRPDGSRILVVTTKIGDMETTMSIELSKPTQIENDTKDSNDEKAEEEERERNTAAPSTLEALPV